MRFIITITAFFLLFARLSAQDINLANQYYANGEYEKAAQLYGELSEKDTRNEFYVTRYVDCLLFVEDYENCEKFIKKTLKKTPENNFLYVLYGRLFERKGELNEASAQYDKAIEKMAPDFNAVNRLANTFTQFSKYEHAIKTYERGAQIFSDNTRFAFNLGELYRRMGEPTKMIQNYLDALTADPSRLPTIQTLLARYLGDSEFPELQTQLYARIQTKDNPELIELLAWSFVQRRDFKSALRQYKALDKRLNENGSRIFKLANDASAAKDYDTAIAGFEYIMAEKEQMNPFYFDSKKNLMDCRRKKITDGFSYSIEDLRTLETEYEQFIAQFGKGRQTAAIVLQLAELEALYINDLEKATNLLSGMLEQPGLDPKELARIKINLADYYLMASERWESTLLYSQVDKAFKEEQIGQEARFKNARLSYFMGDFQWAQAQFDVLKASTSKLIANDALDLAVFIMDNLNLDTTADAVSLYSAAELLVFQNRFEEAFSKLDTLKRDFPEHSLKDDILYLEGQIYEKKRDWNKASAIYEDIVAKYKEEIRADNALYALAQIQEYRLKDLEKAKASYEKIFLDYSGSVFAVDARKRFRILRGDKIQ